MPLPVLNKAPATPKVKSPTNPIAASVPMSLAIEIADCLDTPARPSIISSTP